MLTPEKLVGSEVVICPDWLTAKANAVVGDLDPERIKFWANAKIGIKDTDAVLSIKENATASEGKRQIIALRSVVGVLGESGWPRIASLVEAGCLKLDSPVSAGLDAEILTKLYFDYLNSRWQGETKACLVLKRKYKNSLPYGYDIPEFVGMVKNSLFKRIEAAGWSIDEIGLGSAFSRRDYWETVYPEISGFVPASPGINKSVSRKSRTFQKAESVANFLVRTPAGLRPFLLSLWESNLRSDWAGCLLNNPAISEHPEQALILFLKFLNGKTIEAIASEFGYPDQFTRTWVNRALRSFRPPEMEKLLSLVIGSPEVDTAPSGVRVIREKAGKNIRSFLDLTIVGDDGDQQLRVSMDGKRLQVSLVGLGPQSVSAFEQLLAGEKLTVEPQDLRWSQTSLGELLKWLERNDLRPLFELDGKKLKFYLLTEIRYGSIYSLMRRLNPARAA